MRTARAKGLTERQVLIRHVLRNSLIPIISLWGLDFAAVIGGGAILTESVFNLHGVGQYAARVDRPARRPAGAGDHDVRRVLRRRAERARRHRLRAPRPADPARSADERPLLEVADLRVSFAHRGRASCRPSTASRFTVDAGEVVAIVGESGSGKSVTAMTLMGLTRSPNARFEGSATLRRPGAARRLRRRAAQDPRRRDRDGLPGPDDRR